MSAQPKPKAQTAPAPAPARIVWHFGFQKTGTTSIQSVCWRNFDALNSRTALFPKRQWTEALRTSATAWLNGAGAEDAVEEAAAGLATAVAEAGHGTALVTDENVLGVDIYNAHGDIFDFAARILPVIERAARPHSSEFVFYTREMDSWLKSAHAQSIAWARQRLDYDDWRAGLPFATDWAVHLARLQAAVDSPVSFRDMGADADEFGLLGGHLLTRAGIAPDTLASLAPARGGNERLPAGALQFLLEMNRSKLGDKPLNTVRRQVLRHMQLFSSKTED